MCVGGGGGGGWGSQFDKFALSGLVSLVGSRVWSLRAPPRNFSCRDGAIGFVGFFFLFVFRNVFHKRCIRGDNQNLRGLNPGYVVRTKLFPRNYVFGQTYDRSHAQEGICPWDL